MESKHEKGAALQQRMAAKLDVETQADCCVPPQPSTARDMAGIGAAGGHPLLKSGGGGNGPGDGR
eukprot:2659095-Prymnesium_polylepis.3